MEKLVRDKIPEKLMNENAQLEIIKLRNHELENSLIKKLRETVSLENIEEGGKYVDELVEITEIVNSLVVLNKLTDEFSALKESKFGQCRSYIMGWYIINNTQRR